MADNYIEIESTKGIKGDLVKPKIDVQGDEIYWNIRFNIPLDPESVNEDHMDVTDVEGFTLTSHITYNDSKNAIIITPIEPYKPDATYILNISTNVKSAGGNNLKEEIQIVFKLRGASISGFKILKGPEKLDIVIKPSKVMPTPAQIKKEKLPIVHPSLNFFVALGTLVIFVISVVSKNTGFIIAGVVLLLLGIAHIVYQLVNKKAASMKLYNKAAEFFNMGEFGEAIYYIELALKKDPNNNFAVRAKKRL